MGQIIEDLTRLQDYRMVHAHGVFDLLHCGHIRHLQEAKKLGGNLVVTVTSDRFVNKGPGRPLFTARERAEKLAALGCVDYVAVNDAPNAVEAIEAIKPAIYVKGRDYANETADVTGDMKLEREAVERSGGRVVYTDTVTHSSTANSQRAFGNPRSGRDEVSRDEEDHRTFGSRFDAVRCRHVRRLRVCG
jgi:rfaE bifunctional protein nucleotidyltransferase chain/domain